MENKDSKLALEAESDASDATRRQIGAAILGLFGGAVLSGCAGAEESRPAPARLGESAQPATGTANIRWFDKIEGTATLKNTAGSANQVAIVFGYWQPGDGGGGVFFWEDNTADSGAIDDGGTVFQVGTSGRWRRIYAGPLNVAWFGAKGDGTTNDAPAIQNAINAAAKVGGEVWLPPCAGGKGYRVTASLNLWKGVTLRGSRRGMGRGLRWDGFPPPPVPASTDFSSVIHVVHSAVCINLYADTCVDGLEFWYPTQTKTNPPNTNFDFTLKANLNEHGVTIRNVLATNPFKFIYLSCDGALIENVQGWPLHTGLHLGRCGDVVRVKGLHFNSNGLPDVSPEDWDAVRTWVANNGTAILIEGAEGFQFEQIHAMGYFYGMRLVDNPADTFVGSAGHIVNFAFDTCTYGIHVDDKGLGRDGLKCVAGVIIPIQEGLKMTDTTVTTGYGMPRVHMSHVSFTNVTGYTRAIWIGASSRARVWLHGCDFADFNPANAAILNQSPNSIGRLIACEFVTAGTHINSTVGSWTETAPM